MTFKGLLQFKLFSDSVIFLDADQGCVLTCNNYWERGGTLVGKSRERTWRCGGERAVRTETLTLSITITEAGKWRASSSLNPLDYSVQNALKLLSFCVLTTAAPLWQTLLQWWPTLFCYWAKEQESCCSAWVSSVMNCHSTTVPTPDFRMSIIVFSSVSTAMNIASVFTFLLRLYRFVWIIYTSSFSRVRFPFILFVGPKFILIWMVPAKSRIWWSGMWYFKFHSDMSSIENS